MRLTSRASHGSALGFIKKIIVKPFSKSAPLNPPAALPLAHANRSPLVAEPHANQSTLGAEPYVHANQSTLTAEPPPLRSQPYLSIYKPVFKTLETTLDFVPAPGLKAAIDWVLKLIDQFEYSLVLLPQYPKGFPVIYD
jgi:hypothetical protein